MSFNSSALLFLFLAPFRRAVPKHTLRIFRPLCASYYPHRNVVDPVRSTLFVHPYPAAQPQ